MSTKSPEQTSFRTIQEMIGGAIDEDFQLYVENLSHDEALSALGLKRSHSADELKAAYRKAVKLHHPDVGGSLEGIKRVNAAYQKLKSASVAVDADAFLNAARHPDIRVRLKLAQHPDLLSHHIHAILDKEMERGSEDSAASRVVLDHPRIDTNHISKSLRHWDELVREKAIKHPIADETHIDRAIRDRDSFVRKAAINRHNVKMRHIEVALHDDDEDVRKRAIAHLKKRGVFNDRS